MERAISFFDSFAFEPATFSDGLKTFRLQSSKDSRRNSPFLLESTLDF